MSYNLKYTTKEERQKKETEALFKNPRYAREAWKSIGIAILNSPAQEPINMENPTIDNIIEHYSFDSLSRDIADLVEGDRKKPTELEMIFRCQAIHARHNTNAAIFVRDTVGGKPVDESKVEQTNYNMFEQLSDDELEMLVAYRESKMQQEAAAAQREQGEQDDTDNTSTVVYSPILHAPDSSATSDLVEQDDNNGGDTDG